MQKITSDWEFERDLVMIYDYRENWGRKEYKRLCELLMQLEISRILDANQSVEIHSLQVTPCDGRVTICGTFFQDFKSLDDLATSIGLDEKSRILNTINEQVESARIKILNL